jgi:DNA-binding transcriptional regulator LsrR (DeoR family)
VLGNWLDAQGRPVDHPLNRRMVALSLDDLARIPTVVLASGGGYKFEIIRAALRRRCANVLITDEKLAERLAEDREG